MRTFNELSPDEQALAVAVFTRLLFERSPRSWPTEAQLKAFEVLSVNRDMSELDADVMLTDIVKPLLEERARQWAERSYYREREETVMCLDEALL